MDSRIPHFTQDLHDHLFDIFLGSRERRVVVKTKIKKDQNKERQKKEKPLMAEGEISERSRMGDPEQGIEGQKERF